MFGLELLLIIRNIFLLSSIYATIVLVTLLILSKTTTWHWVKSIVNKKLRFWLFTHLVISVGLFIYSFSYWQNTGIGGHSQIPIGYGEYIQNEDFEMTYFSPSDNSALPTQTEFAIDNYKISGNILCAEISDDHAEKEKYDFIVYNLENKTFTTFSDSQEYSNYAKNHSLPMADEFYDFRQHFHEYLKNRPEWRRWLLP
ncbi:hypothetical protein [Foetidibacter luteolus]|uniref:hypothetical protein n=1 Tax=Foetidibacter luteolus TaxID=2608880 RepID=UPI00129ACA55|nr:hypothetical protein [Foetidibacter luteolus]